MVTIGGADLVALSPLIVLGSVSVVLLLGIAIERDHRASAAVAALALVLTLASLPYAARAAPRSVTPLLLIDGFALLYIGLVCAASLVVVVLLLAWFEREHGDHGGHGGHGDHGDHGDHREEVYLLLLLATLGTVVLVAARHFAALFLGLELLSVSLYAMIANPRRSPEAVEAGIKYLVLAAASSAFLLFGMALIYAETGALGFAELAQRLGERSPGAITLAGLALLISGVGFKLALVPFHLWTADVYAGAPAPVAAFIASVSKGGVFAVALRFFVELGEPGRGVRLALVVLAIASMLLGNLLALLQHNVKRLLAYSSIAHLGYLLVALITSSGLAVEAATYYLIAYTATTLVAFGVVTVLSDARGEADTLEHFRGLFWQRPALAAVFTVALLSLAGIPATAGFVAKFYLLLAGVDADLWLLSIVLVIGSVIGLFYYLRVVVVMFDRTAGATAAAGAAAGAGPPRLAALTLTALALPLVLLGVYPAPLIELVARMVRGLP